MASRFVPNPGFLAEFSRSKQLLDVLKGKADEAADNARAVAPVQFGDYQDGIEAVSGIEGGMAVGRVNANHFTSHWIEAGTSDTPTFAPLRKGAEATGLNFEARGR